MKHRDCLIIDDEQRFANMLAKRLSLRGCECEVSYKGLDALNLIARKRFALVLLDLHLPDIYGVEVLARIKEISPKTPVVIITGHGSEEDREICIQQGAHAFMNKPVGIEDLIGIWTQVREMSA